MNKDNEQREISRKKPFTAPSNTPEYRDGFDLSWLQWIIVLIGFYLILN